MSIRNQRRHSIRTYFAFAMMGMAFISLLTGLLVSAYGLHEYMNVSWENYEKQIDLAAYLMNKEIDSVESLSLLISYDETLQKNLTEIAKTDYANNYQLLRQTLNIIDDPLWQEASPIRNRAPSGSGGLLGTLQDYERFVHMLLNEGELEGVRILRPETVRLMHTPSAANGLELNPGCIWGLSMLIFRDNARSGFSLFDGTYGWSGAYGTHFFIAPAQSLEMVMMLNRSNIGGADSHISRAVEKAIFEAVAM